MTGCLFGILRYFTLMQLVYAYKVQTITQMTSLFWFQSFLYYDEPTKNEQFVFRHQMKLYLKDHVTSVWWNPNTDLAKTTFCLGQRLRVRLAWFEALKVEYQSLSFKSSISLYHLELRLVWKNIRYEPYLSNQTIKIWVTKNGRPFSEYFLLMRTPGLQTIQICSLLNLIFWRSKDIYGSKMNG